MAVVVAGLTVGLVKEWARLGLLITRLFCLAIIGAIVAEGLLQPDHHCTRENLLCTGRLFLVFVVFWVVLRPVEWLFATHRKKA